MGYCPDFVHQAVGPLASQIKTRGMFCEAIVIHARLYYFLYLGIRVVSNAGGVNPHACAKALSDAAMKQGVSFNVAVITGDDLMPQVITLPVFTNALCFKI